MSSVLLTNLLIDVPEQCSAANFRHFFHRICTFDLFTRDFESRGQRQRCYSTPKNTRALQLMLNDLQDDARQKGNMQEIGVQNLKVFLS